MKVCRVHRCFMDPAKPSSKPVVSYHLLKLCLTLVFIYLHAGMQVTTLRSLQANRRELSFNKLCLTLVFFHLHAGMQVTTLRSLQANRVVSYRLLNCA